MTGFSFLRVPAFSRRDAGATRGAEALPWSQRLGWSARRWVQHLGAPGVVAAGLLVMVPAFYVSAIVPAQQRLEAARSSAATLHQRIDRAASAANAGNLAPADQLSEFYRAFPAENDSPAWLGKIFASASSRGLHLDQGEYDAKPEKVGKLVRFYMTLPVKGEYAQIRKFLTGLPSEVPVVALEQVQFERQKIGDPQVDAKLKLALFLEKSP